MAAAGKPLAGKDTGKYATLTILRIAPDGMLEYINCGNVPPYLYGSTCSRLAESNVPVGLLEDAPFHAGSVRLAPGDRVLVVTDGVTESESADGHFFGEERLATAEFADASLDQICTEVQNFSGSLATGDDCTLLDIRYLG